MSQNKREKSATKFCYYQQNTVISVDTSRIKSIIARRKRFSYHLIKIVVDVRYLEILVCNQILLCKMAQKWANTSDQNINKKVQGSICERVAISWLPLEFLIAPIRIQSSEHYQNLWRLYCSSRISDHYSSLHGKWRSSNIFGKTL